MIYFTCSNIKLQSSKVNSDLIKMFMNIHIKVQNRQISLKNVVLITKIYTY